MNLWPWMPVPAIASLLWAAGTAASRKGAPAGRTLFLLIGLAGSVCLGGLVWTQEEPAPQWAPALDLAIGLVAPLLCWLWIVFALRFGQSVERPFRRPDLLSVGALIAALALLAWRASEGGLSWVDEGSSESLVRLDSLADRAMTVFALLAGAVGVVRLQGLRDAARREGKESLRRAAVGPLIASLALFLFSSQALLYGGTTIRILSLASLFLVPAGVLLAPVFLASRTEAGSLPQWASRAPSSLVLIGLGSFLIALAVLGQLIHRFLPDRELIWFYWGGAILLVVFASLWLIPGLRETLRRWFAPAQSASGDPRWEWARVNQALVPVESPVQLLAKLSSLLEDLLGRTTVALWLVAPSGDRMIPVGEADRGLPELESDNPLRLALSQGDGLLDLSMPPKRLSDLPPYVENQELVEWQGFRVFIALRAGEEELGVLALAPKARFFGVETRGMLENLGAQLSNVVWGMTLAERLARTREGVSFHRLGSFVLHDLKNAVGVLRGAISNAPAHMDDPRFRAELITTLETSVSRMEGTLQRLRAGMMGEPSPSPINLAASFRRLERDLSPLAAKAGARLSFEAWPMAELLSDPERLETILHNLLRNAIEASPAGGTVTLKAAWTDGGKEGQRRIIRITVADQGNGADLERVRRSLHRPLPSEKPEGWGVGLYQSNLLAESMGGTLEAEATDSGGLLLTLALPVGAARLTPDVA